MVQWPGQEPVAIPPKIATQLAEDAGRVDEGESASDILVAVNTDPANVQEGIVHVPIEDMGIGDDEPYVVHDLLTGARHTWRAACETTYGCSTRPNSRATCSSSSAQQSSTTVSSSSHGPSRCSRRAVFALDALTPGQCG